MTPDPNLILGVVAIAGVGIPCIVGSLDRKRKAEAEEADRKRRADAEEAEQRRQHEINMRQKEVEQGLIHTALNYDFARDAISANPSPGYLERIQPYLTERVASLGETPAENPLKSE